MKIFTSLLLVNLLTCSIYATHNKAGEIQYKQIGEKTIQSIIITHTDPISVPADRDSLLIDWGDGSSEWVLRNNGDGELLNANNKKNIYIAEHTYNTFGEYTLAVLDQNRNDGILNINNGNSSIFSFYVSNTFTLSDQTNSSPQTLFDPIDRGSVFTPFEHLATAYDLDGDSLSYALIIPQSADGVDVSNFQELSEFSTGSNNQVNIDPQTGHLVWDSPEIAGIYSIAIEISSFRDGIKNGSFIRDILIEIANSSIPGPTIVQNNLPTFGEINQVTFGDTIQLSIEGRGTFNLASLEAKGSLLNEDIQASTFEETFFSDSEIRGDYIWITGESQIRNTPYVIAFKLINDQNVAGFYLARFVVNDIENNVKILNQKEHGLKVYPNPATDFLQLENIDYDQANYKIFSSVGQLLKEGKVNGNKVEINTIPNGAYFLLISEKYSFRFTKIDK